MSSLFTATHYTNASLQRQYEFQREKRFPRAISLAEVSNTILKFTWVKTRNNANPANSSMPPRLTSNSETNFSSLPPPALAVAMPSLRSTSSRSTPPERSSPPDSPRYALIIYSHRFKGQNGKMNSRMGNEVSAL